MLVEWEVRLSDLSNFAKKLPSGETLLAKELAASSQEDL